MLIIILVSLLVNCRLSSDNVIHSYKPMRLVHGHSKILSSNILVYKLLLVRGSISGVIEFISICIQLKAS